MNQTFETRGVAHAASVAAQAEAKRQNDAASRAAAQRQREAQAIGAALDPESLEQGEPT